MPRARPKDFDYDRGHRILREQLGAAYPRLAAILRRQGGPQRAGARQLALRMCEYDPVFTLATAQRALRAFAWALGSFALAGYGISIADLCSLRLEYDLHRHPAGAAQPERLRWSATYPAASQAQAVLSAYLLDPGGQALPRDYDWRRLLPERPCNPERSYASNVRHGRYRRVRRPRVGSSGR